MGKIFNARSAEPVPRAWPRLDSGPARALDRAIEFREISHGTDEYRMALTLRQEVLRTPLGLRFSEEDLAAEADQRHFGLFADDCLLAACVTAVPLAGGVVKFRQMAVAPNLRENGHGRAVLQAAEDAMRRAGFVRATLHARLAAAGFYEKLGYRRHGPDFTEVGIPHVAMEKEI